MNRFMNFVTALAVVLILSAGAMAQDKKKQTEQAAAPEAPKATAAPATIGSPVVCVAKGYWSGNSITLTLNKLDRESQTADVDAIDANGYALSRDFLANRGGVWTFKENILEYNRPNSVRYTLAVDDRKLRGSFKNYNAPAASKSEVVFDCNGSTSGIIVR